MRESSPARSLLQTSPICAVAIAVLLSAYIAGAQPPQATPPSLTVNARLVILDVNVTDSAGHSVDGLTAKDFQIYEDGRLRPIKSVEQPTAHALPLATISKGIAAVFDPSSPESFGRGPVNVLVLDQLNTHFADSSFARDCLRDYLNKQPAVLPEPTTLLDIADSGFQTIYSFTRDRDALLRALAATPPEYAWKLEENGKADYGPIERLDATLRALEQIAQSYAAISGRKSLIWVGGGFPTLDPTTIDRGDAQEVRNTLRHVTDLLLDTHVTLYAVDPTSSAAGVAEITDSTQLEFAELAGDTLTVGSDPFNSNEDFDRLGPLTGGRVVRGRNDVAGLIASAVESAASFYTISYAPGSDSSSAARFRNIHIICTRPGLSASTRIGYYSGQARQTSPEELATYDLTTAAESRLRLNGLTVTVSSDPDVSNAPHAFVVRAGTEGLTWKPQPDGAAVASIYVMAVSLDKRGRMLSHKLQGMTASARPGTDLNDSHRTANFALSVSPAPHAVILRFIVRDSVSGRMGSFDLPLGGH
jgi:VWFA-related protein